MHEKLTKLNAEIDKASTIVADSNTPSSGTIRTIRQETSEDIECLKNTINHFNLLNICRTLHQTTAERTFFSNANRCSLSRTYTVS